MKVIVAKTAGFCKGVKDALDITLEAIQKRKDGESICTYGPLIHNRQVLAMLEEKGVREENLIENCAGKKVVIRAHGIPPEERQSLRAMGAGILDATCKRVAKVQGTIKRHARHGFSTIIVGDADHAEVIGLMGYTEGRGTVINQPEQLDELPREWDSVLMVAQTTQNEELFQEIQDRFLKRYPGGVVQNTICGSTHERQAEIRQICSQVEAMVVVGGYHSGNTLRLAEVARECAVPTYHVETETELNTQEMARYSCVGVSAGASTPNWIIRNIVKYLESIQPETTDLKFRLRRVLDFLGYANVYAALGAALLQVAVQALTGLWGSIENSVMAALYVFAVHSLNIYLDRTAIQLNDPGRAAFYQKWKRPIMATSVAAVITSLWIALNESFSTFFTMAALIFIGLLYGVPVILPIWQRSSLYTKIKDIPTSKTFSVPVAWAGVIVVVPYLSQLWPLFGHLLYAFLIIFLIVLIRTVLLDLLAVHGDRLVGKETLVVLIGVPKTVQYIKGMLVLLGCMLFMGPLSGLSTYFAYGMLPAVVVYWWYVQAELQSRLNEDPTFEILVESVLIGTGLLALMWRFGA
ncbi:MAG: 4-hydroxy-3-methylbut-2-enyl diphosphate reductase [Syntrophobacteraceae bacterium]